MTNIITFENIYKEKLLNGRKCLILENFPIKLYPYGFYNQGFPTLLIISNQNDNYDKPFSIIYNHTMIKSSKESCYTHSIEINYFDNNDCIEII